MRVCLITAAPDHPLLAAVTDLLSACHEVVTLDPGNCELPPAGPTATGATLADVYLLKCRTPQAISLAARLERQGAPVLNSAAATALCQDRTKMATLAHCAGLPFAGTRTVDSLAELAASLDQVDAHGAEPGFGEAARRARPSVPLVIKSRHSRSDDLVARADDASTVRKLAALWPQEPVVVQEFTENSGWDHKLWAVGGRLFAGLRRSELSPDGTGPTQPLAVHDLPPGWAGLVLRVGRVFGLDIYGVDLLDTGDGTPLIVDINAFPGIRAQPGAPEAVTDLALARATAAVPRETRHALRTTTSAPTRGRGR